MREWFETCADNAEKKSQTSNRNTWAAMLRQTSRNICEFAGYDVKVVDVDKQFVKSFIDFLQNDYTIQRGAPNQFQKLKPKSIHKKYTCLRFVLNEAVRNGIILQNPCNQLDSSEKVKPITTQREYLTIEELKRLKETPTNSKVRNIYLFMCYCGLRISDVKRLRWSDIEENNGTMIVRVVQQKTAEPLYLPLSDSAISYLPEKDTNAKNDLVFADIPSEQVMNKALKIWTAKAGISKHITLHTARHTFATLLLTKGADIYTTSKLLGHTDIKTTQIYAKIVDSKKVAAVNLLNDL